MTLKQVAESHKLKPGYSTTDLEEAKTSFVTDLHKTMNKEYSDSLQKSTESQYLCTEWKDQRIGRITGSNFHRVYSRAKTLRKDPSADPTALLSTIMGYNETPTTLAMKHGQGTEPHAKRAYVAIMKTKHTKIKAMDTGIVTLPEHPYISASPDLMIEDKCCGKGLSVQV